MLTQTSLLGLIAFAVAAPVEHLTKRDAQITFKNGVTQQKLGGQVLNFTLDTSGSYALLTDKNGGQGAALQSIVMTGYSPDKSSCASDSGQKYSVELGQYGHIPTIDTGELYKDVIEVAGKTIKDYPFVLVSEPQGTSDNYLDLSFNGTLAGKLGYELQFTESLDTYTTLVDTEVKIGSDFNSPGVYHKVNAANEIEDVELTFEDRTSRKIKAVLDFNSGYTTTPSDFSDSFPFVGFEGGGVTCDASGNLELKIGDQKLSLPKSTVVGDPINPSVCNSWFQMATGGDLETLHLGANILQHLIVTYDFNKGGVFVKSA